MASKEIPELIQESIDLSKEYLLQETVEPAKRLGKVAAFGFAGAILFGLATLVGSVALNRFIIRLLPDGRAWSGLGYVLSALALLGLAALTIVAGKRGAPETGRDL